jgi:GT2 family glycosyltransferase
MHRRFPSCTNIIFSFLHKKYKSFLPKGVREYMYLDKDFKTSFYIKQVAGAFIMTTRDVVESIGGLFDEERFPLFYNDVDFSYRIYEHSLKILCVSDKSILHLKGESTGKLNFLKSGKYYAPAALWFFKKHNKKFDYLVLKISFLILFSTLVILKMISFRTQDRKNEYLKTKKILFEIVRI